jgi:hypothetical protein
LFFRNEGTPFEIKKQLGDFHSLSVLVDVSKSTEIKSNIARISPGMLPCLQKKRRKKGKKRKEKTKRAWRGPAQEVVGRFSFFEEKRKKTKKKKEKEKEKDKDIIKERSDSSPI